MTNLFRHVIALLAFCGTAASLQSQNLTVQVGTPPGSPTPLVSHNDVWAIHKGTNAPQANWQTIADGTLNADWGNAPGGFGYGDNGINTIPGPSYESTMLTDMVNRYTTLFIRRTFTVASAVDTNVHLLLTMDYDDGFVAYLDGVEIRRANTTNGIGSVVTATQTTGANSHEASCCNAPTSLPTVYDLGAVGDRLAVGTHVLAIVGLNQSVGSSDFHLIADLSLAGQGGSVADNGFYALTTDSTVTLSGTNTVAGSTRVTVNGNEASYNLGNGTWTNAVSLAPGYNRLFIAALDSAGNVLSNRTQNVVRETSRQTIGGTLSSSVLASNAGTILHVTSSVVVPTNVTLDVANGAVVLVNPGASIVAQDGGRIHAHGTFDQNVFFTVNVTSGGTWGPLSATGTNAMLEVSFADVARSQVSATLGAHGLIEDSAIHDFDPGAIGILNRPILMCNYASLFEVRRCHIRNYYECLVRNGLIQVEQCLFENISGDALDFDSAQPGSYTRNCTYRHGVLGNVDAVDIGPGDLPGSTDTRIENCIMFNFPFDKGVSVGDGESSHGIIVSNCLIYACNAGVMSKDLCEVSVRNCTIVGNDSGLTNYNKTSPASPTGGGITTNTYNNIVWNNLAAIGMANGGQLFADHNDFGNTNWPGTGNFDADPLFVNASQRNYRLQPASPARGSGRGGADLGVTYPLGGIPMPPLALAVISSGTNAPLVKWIDDSQNEDGVLVQRSTDAVNWSVIARLPAEATNYLDESAVVGQKYFYHAQHTNYVAASPNSNIGSGQRQSAVITVGGTISVNTTWAAGSSIVVTSSVNVATGATLTIESCATVLFNQGASLTVNGLLLAEGSSACRILFGLNAGASSWGGIRLANAASTHRIRFADFDSSSADNISANGTAAYIENIWWTNTTAQVVDLVNSSVTLLDSYIPGGNGNEPVHFSSMPATGYAIIKGNVFGAPQGYNDSIDFTGGNRPGPIVQFIDNVFLAAVDDCLDLDATDAHIEGNIFMNVHQDASRPSTANAVSTGEGTGTSEVVLVRNIFYDCDHALLLKDMGSAVFENNTVVTIETNQFSASRAAYVQFGEPHRGVPGGRGILMNGNILWDLHSTTPFLAFTNGTMFMVANDNIIQGTNMAFSGNSTNDPMFVNWQTGITHLNIRSNLALLAGSPAKGTGPNGLDRGALVPGGASISGEPIGSTTNKTATLTIAGPGVYAYKWKLNNGPWSSEVALTNNFIITANLFSNAVPITLSNLTDGIYTVSVIGKNSAGFWQDTNSATVSKTWSVGAGNPATNFVGGTLAANTTWSGTVVVTSSVVVPNGLSLSVQQGTEVRVGAGLSVTAQAGGVINVQGSSTNRVRFIPNVGSTAWGNISGTGANSSVMVRHAEVWRGGISFGTSATGLIEDCYIHEVSSAIVANSAALVTVRRVHVSHYAETIYNSTLVLVEDSLFENLTSASSDAVELQDSPLGCIVRRCTLRNGRGANTDGFDCNGSRNVLIAACVIHDFTDKAISFGSAGQGGQTCSGMVISNCLIYNVNIGIALKDGATASFYQNTIADSVSGLSFYQKFAGGGGGQMTNGYNNILFNNTTNISLNNSSTLVTTQSDLQGTNFPGAGNVSVDPLFVNEAARDYRLALNSPVRGVGRNGLDMGALYPNGAFFAPSHPVLRPFVVSSNVSSLQFWADPVRSYTVQCATNLTGAPWTAVLSLPTNINAQFVTLTNTTVPNAQFYRLVTPAQP